MRTFMDEIRYNDLGNEVMMFKRVVPAESTSKSAAGQKTAVE